MGLLDNQNESTYYAGSDLGSYQFTSLQNVIDQFMLAYVGEGKIITKVKRPEVVFHAQRTLQEFSFDVFKSTKAIEIEVPNTLLMSLPQDYVNYVKICYVDGSGIQHPLYPNRYSSNPTNPKQTGSIGNENFIDDNADGTIDLDTESTTWERYKSLTPNENTNHDFDYDDDIYDANLGQRYGLDPQHAQINGSYYIDEKKGYIHFSSNISGKHVTLEYVSDSLGTDAEMQVHKLAEEAMYKNMAYAILSTRANTPINTVLRFKKEARATRRNAKLRLSNIKPTEIIQTLRGKSKHIKH